MRTVEADECIWLNAVMSPLCLLANVRENLVLPLSEHHTCAPRSRSNLKLEPSNGRAGGKQIGYGST